MASLSVIPKADESANLQSSCTSIACGCEVLKAASEPWDGSNAWSLWLYELRGGWIAVEDTPAGPNHSSNGLQSPCISELMLQKSKEKGGQHYAKATYNLDQSGMLDIHFTVQRHIELASHFARH